MSDKYLVATGQGHDGTDFRLVDNLVGKAFTESSDSRLQKLQQSCLDAVTLWSAVWLILSDKKIDSREYEALSDLCGEVAAKKALKFASKNGLQRVRKKLCEASSQFHLLPDEFISQFDTDLEKFGCSLGLSYRESEARKLVFQKVS